MKRRALAIAIVVASAPALAHFKLVSPAANLAQDNNGSPQKSAPCGQNDSGQPAVPTNAVTQLMTGQMIDIEIDETIFHPGHYRIQLAESMNLLPAQPAVTPGSTACGSLAIDPAPQMPLLADGLFVHTQRFTANQTAQVRLPAGYRCTNCVLQVAQFMTVHAAPCFYYHCAQVTISDDPTNPPMGDTGSPMDDAAGCCSTSRGAGASSLFAFVVGAFLLRPRSRSRR
ncbi:MAG: SCE4755 family polysaccharide monooxygenase-like protein [Kofleriaceae bacterium]